MLVTSDGSDDRTVELARAVAAHDPRVRVLDLSRRGKVAAQDGAVEEARGAVIAFSDANAFWDPDALRRLVAPFADPEVGYVCGALRFLAPQGQNQEGAYWRYELAVRGLESRLSSVTGGNGAIYATRRESYIVVDPRMGHDLSFPFNMVKRGWRAVFAPAARAQEKMVPTTEGEFRRKRRMMSHAWPIVVEGGMLDPRGYGALYALPDPLPPAAALRDAAAASGRARIQRRPGPGRRRDRLRGRGAGPARLRAVRRAGAAHAAARPALRPLLTTTCW